MPFVSINTSVSISEEKKDSLQKEIGELITIIPGKNIDNCMTQIQGDGSFFISGKPVAAVFCEVRLRGAAPEEKKKQLVEKLYHLFSKELDAQKVYTNILEFSSWGNGPDYVLA